MDSPSRYLIYVLSDPRDGAVRYVGKTEGVSGARGRFNSHMHEARDGNRRQHVYSWIRSLLRAKLEPVMEVFEEHKGHEDLVQAERFYVSYFRSLGMKLTNHTDGGEGCLGYRHSQETKEKMRTATRHLGPRRPVLPHTLESRLLVSRTKSGLTRSQQDEIVAAYMAGENGPVLAERFGVSTTCIAKIVRLLGKMRTQPESLRKLSEEQQEETCRLYSVLMWSSERIAEKLGVSGKGILNLLKRRGVPRRSAGRTRKSSYV